MSENAEIKAKLTVETEGAKSGLEGVGKVFEHLGEKTHEVQHDLAQMAKQAIATAVGLDLFHGIESMKEFGHEVFGAAMNLGSEEKSLAQVMAVGDRTGRSFIELKGQAHEVHEALEEIAVESGQMTSQVVESFQSIAARSHKSAEEVQEFVGTIAQAAKVTPGGISAISEGFANMELGVIRARNPVVQMIAQMHLLAGNSKQVAAQLMKMAPEKAMALGEEAIQKMADKAKNLPLSFGQTVQSLRNVREQFFEIAGQPILKAMTGPIKELQRYVLENKATIAAWAEGAGRSIGNLIGKGAGLMKDAFKYLDEHGAELADDLMRAASAIGKVVAFIYEHREAIALAFGAKAALGIAGSVAGGAGGLASGAIGLAGAIGPVIGSAVSGALAAAKWAGTAQFGVSAAGLGSSITGAATAAVEGLGGAATATLGALNVVLPPLAAMAVAVGGVAFAVYEAKGLFADLAQEQRATIEAEHNFVERLGDVDYTSKEYQETLKNLRDKHEDLAAAALMAAMDLKVLGKEARQLVAPKITMDQEDIANRALGSVTAGTSQQNHDFLNGRGAFAVPDKAVINFNGGQTFHVKQEFRNADPDRVLVAFRRDVVNQALNRKQVRLSTPFG